MGNLEPLPPSAIQQQPGATLPTQRHGAVRSTTQPQLPLQPLPPETALQQTSVRLPQQPVSTVVTRFTQPSGSSTAARIVQLPTQPIPQNTVCVNPVNISLGACSVRGYSEYKTKTYMLFSCEHTALFFY